MTKRVANPEAMENMIRILTRFIELQDNIVDNLKTQYENVGNEWDDEKYIELGEVISQAIAAIKGSYATLSLCITKVQSLKSIMENYLSQHIV